jgi:hypothetical protein
VLSGVVGSEIDEFDEERGGCIGVIDTAAVVLGPATDFTAGKNQTQLMNFKQRKRNSHVMRTCC